MKQIVHSQYAGFFFAGLALIILSAWFSIGFYHIDEHVQILEFASWKMGITPTSSLPWEFYKQVRASLLPYSVILISKILQLVGLYNPFTVTFLLRLFTGIASWFITCLLCLQLTKNMKTEQGKKLFVLMALFLCYVPFLSVRFTSENVAGIIFLYGVYFLLKDIEKGRGAASAYIAAGFLFGISFFLRILFIVAILGFIVWLIKIKKIRWKPLFILFTALLVAIGLNLWLDSLFYGKPVYGLLNLTKIYVHHKGGMQTNPWWFYMEQYAGRVVPPFSLFFLVAFFLGIYKRSKDPFVWIILPFVLIHFVVRHKELRFLFSVSFIFIYIAAIGIDYLLTQKTYLKWHKYIYAAFLVITIPLLLFKTFMPANISVSYCRYIYNDIKGKDVPLFVNSHNESSAWNPLSHSLFVLQNNSDYSFLATNNTFYKNPSVKLVAVNNTGQLNDSLDVLKRDTAYYFCKSSEEFITPVRGYKVTEVYRFSPLWLKDFIQWVCDDKAAGWKIYCITKT